jgi:hypothetical protein
MWGISDRPFWKMECLFSDMPRELLHSATSSLNTLEKSKVFMLSKNQPTISCKCGTKLKTSLKKEEEMFLGILKNELTICRSNTW